jgi:hypothetical protein
VSDKHAPGACRVKSTNDADIAVPGSGLFDSLPDEGLRQIDLASRTVRRRRFVEWLQFAG